jgi:hypothetical protein
MLLNSKGEDMSKAVGKLLHEERGIQAIIRMS